MPRLLKHKLTLAIVAIALAASAAGAYAATSASGGSNRQAFLNDVARRLHITPSQLKRAFQGAYADRLAAAVAAGRLTKAQASAIEQRLRQSGAVPFGPGLGLLAPAAGFAPGVQVPPGARLRLIRPGWPVRPGALGRPALIAPGVLRRLYAYPPNVALPSAGPGGPVFFGFGLGLFPAGAKAALSYLGLSAAKLQSEMRSGKTLAQIATARGKTARGLQSAITAAITARLAKRVARGRLTSAQARRVQAMLEARVTAIVNQRLNAMFPVVSLLRRLRGTVVLPRGFRMIHPRVFGFFAAPAPAPARATKHP